MSKITVIGSTNIDLVAKAKRLPATGETVIGEAFQIFHGGKGANQAVGVARLGGDVRFITKIGADQFGQQARENQLRYGIAPDFILQDEQAPTGVALIEVDERGQNRIVVVPGANARLTVSDLEKLRPALETSDVILIQLEIPLETVGYILKTGRRANAAVILNPAPAHELPQDFFGAISVITPNETEAAAMTSLPAMQLTAIAEALRRKGVGTVVLTLGEQGAFFQSADESGEVPTWKMKAVDTTAAGDAFNAGLAVALAEGQKLPSAVRFANAVAALSVTKMGAQPSMPTRSDVEKLLAA
ncbi:MAG: ribokinase [Candidatus Zhuqueibacterota bacterium]